jgi:Na+-transporting NADH:ubiquinone oxidoreductase subunit C
MKDKLKKLWKVSKQPLYFAGYLAVLGMLVTGVAIFGYNTAAPVIEENRQDKIKTNVALLFSAEDGYVTNLDLPTNSYQQLNYDLVDEVYEVSKDGKLYAIIYDMQTAGRNGTINALVAVDPYTDTIIGAVYYNHSETPGKGSVYADEPELSKIIGDSVTQVEFDSIASVSTTYKALRVMYDAITEHYINEEVHIDG